jgi:hypothetical protein
MLRWMYALKKFSAHLGIVLRHLQYGRIFLHREALIRDRSGKRIVRFCDNALLISLLRLGEPLFISLLESDHALKRCSGRVELLFGDASCGT